MRRQKRSIEVRMSSADLVQRSGREQAFRREMRIATPDLAPPNETVALRDPTPASVTHATAYRIIVAQRWLEMSEAGH